SHLQPRFRRIVQASQACSFTLPTYLHIPRSQDGLRHQQDRREEPPPVQHREIQAQSFCCVRGTIRVSCWS
ncbi:hypothetical protein B0H10DRAFT_2440361, partial [Mycena sp. CBHHK59/15]